MTPPPVSADKYLNQHNSSTRMLPTHKLRADADSHIDSNTKVADGNESESEEDNDDAHDAGSEQKLSAAAIFREEFTDFDMHVSFCSTAGDRAHMEDVCVHAHNYFNNCPVDVVERCPYHYFAVFDGHGGRHASEFVSTHLLDFITQQPGFWRYDDDRAVMQAMYDGFIQCHVIMWKHALPTWPLLPNGHRSTAGTTASVAILRDSKLYIGHVGDSGIVMVERRTQQPQQQNDASSLPQTSSLLCAHRLTDDHKPESPEELDRIHNAGGSVRAKQGVHRVVWKRPLLVPVVPSSQQDSYHQQQQQQYVVKYSIIPFLAVARSLGDFWSFNNETNEFIVSPAPDVSCINLKWPRHRGLVIGSDGLWNFCRAEECVELVEEVDRLREMWLWQMAMMSSKRKHGKKCAERKLQTSSLSSFSAQQPALLRRRRTDEAEKRGGTSHHQTSHHTRASSLLSLPSSFAVDEDNGGVGESAAAAAVRSRHSTGGGRFSATNSSVENVSSACSDRTTSTDDESIMTDETDDDEDADTTTTTTTTSTTDDAESLASVEFQTLHHEANDVNVADCIIHKVVGRCSARHLRADNIAVFVVLFEPKASSSAAAPPRIGVESRNSMRSADSLSMIENGVDEVEDDVKSVITTVGGGSNASALLDTSTVFSASARVANTGNQTSNVDVVTAILGNVGDHFKVEQHQERINDGLEAINSVGRTEENGAAEEREAKRRQLCENTTSSGAAGRKQSNGTLDLMKQHLRRNTQVNLFSTKRRRHRRHRDSGMKSAAGNIDSVVGAEQGNFPADDVSSATSAGNADAHLSQENADVLQTSVSIDDREGWPTPPSHKIGQQNISTMRGTHKSRSMRRKKRHRKNHLKNDADAASSDASSVFLSTPLDAVVKYEAVLERLHSLLRPPVEQHHSAAVRQQFLNNAVKPTNGNGGVQFYVNTPRTHPTASSMQAGSSSNNSSVRRVGDGRNVHDLHENNESKTSLQNNDAGDNDKISDDVTAAATPPPLDGGAGTNLPLKDYLASAEAIPLQRFDSHRKLRGINSSHRHHHQHRHKYYYRKLHIHNAPAFGPKQALQRMLGQVQAGFNQQHRALFNLTGASNTAATGTAAAANNNGNDIAACSSSHVAGGESGGEAIPFAIHQHSVIATQTPPSFCRVMGVRSLKKNSVKPFNIPLSIDGDKTRFSVMKSTSTSKFDFMPYQPTPLPPPRAPVVPTQSQPLAPSSSPIAAASRLNYQPLSASVSNNSHGHSGWFSSFGSNHHHHHQPRTNFSFATGKSSTVATRTTPTAVPPPPPPAST